MSLILLDTNVLTEGWKRQPDPLIEEWMASHDWLIPVVVIAEIQAGAEESSSPTEKAPAKQ